MIYYVPRHHNLHLLEARDGVQDLLLHLHRVRARQAIGVHHVRVQPLGLQPHNVLAPVGKPLHLLEQGRAVPRTHPAPIVPVVVRQQMRVVHHQLVRRRGGERLVALDQPVHQGHALVGVQVRKGPGRVVARLLLEGRPINGAAVQPRRRARLEPPQRQLELRLQGVAEPDGGGLELLAVAEVPTRGIRRLAQVALALEERPRGNHHVGGQQRLPRRRRDAPHGLAVPPGFVEHQVLHAALENLQVGRGRQLLAHRLPVPVPVRLGPRAPHGRPLAGVQDLEMDARLVNDPPHDAVQGVDFPDQVAFANAANRGVAGHFAHRLHLLGDQHGLGPRPGTGGGRLAPCVAPAHDNHVVGVGGRRHGEGEAREEGGPPSAACGVGGERAAQGTVHDGRAGRGQAKGGRGGEEDDAAAAAAQEQQQGRQRGGKRAPSHPCGVWSCRTTKREAE